MNDEFLLAFESIQLENDLKNAQSINKRLAKKSSNLNIQKWDSRDNRSGYHRSFLADGSPNYNFNNTNRKLIPGQVLPASKPSSGIIPGYQDSKPAI